MAYTISKSDLIGEDEEILNNYCVFDVVITEEETSGLFEGLPVGTYNGLKVSMRNVNAFLELSPPLLDPGISVEASAVLDRMVNLSTAEEEAIIEFVDGQVALGNWGMVDEVFCFALNATDSLTGFKEFTATVGASMTHDPGEGYIASSLSSYIDTGIAPKALADGSYNYNLTDAMASIYVHTPTFTVGSSTRTYMFGAGNTTTSAGQGCSMYYRSSTDDYSVYLNKIASSSSHTNTYQLNNVLTTTRDSSNNLDMWFNATESADTKSADLAPEHNVHVCGRNGDDGTHNNGTGLKGTYAMFAIGAGEGFDVDGWQSGIRQLMYAIGHRPSYYIDPDAGTNSFGSEASPFNMVTGSDLENMTGDQYGARLLFNKGTTLYDGIEWSSVRRFEMNSYGTGDMPILDGSKVVDTSGNWVSEGGGVYSNSTDFPDPPGDVGVWISDGTDYQMCHWRQSEAELTDATLHSYSNGYTKYYDEGTTTMYVRADDYDLVTDSSGYATTLRMNEETYVTHFTGAGTEDITVKNLQFQRGGSSNLKVVNLVKDYRVDNVVSMECGDRGDGNGHQCFAVSGTDINNKATNVHMSNIVAFGLWNANGNAIETKDVDGGVFEDWVVHDINNNVFEWWLTTTNCTFRRVQAWNCKQLVWAANAAGGLLHEGNLVENCTAVNFVNYKRQTGAGGVTIKIATGRNNTFRNNTFVGQRVAIIDETVVGDGVIEDNVYENNIIFMDAVAGSVSKPIMRLSSDLADANVENNVFYTADDDPADVYLEFADFANSLVNFQAFSLLTSSVAGDPLLADVNSGGGVAPDTQPQPDLTIGSGSAAEGVANANMPSVDVLNNPRSGTAAGAHDEA